MILATVLNDQPGNIILAAIMFGIVAYIVNITFDGKVARIINVCLGLAFLVFWVLPLLGL